MSGSFSDNPSAFCLLPILAALSPLLACGPPDRPVVRPEVIVDQVDLSSIPWLPGEVLHGTFDARDLTRCGDLLVASGHPGVMTLPLDGGGEPSLVETPGDARHAACWGDGLLVADGHAGLAVVAGGTVARLLDLGGEVTWVAVEGTRALVTLKGGALAVLELGSDGYAEGAGIHVLGTVALPGYLRFAAFATDDLAWVVGYSHGVALVDIGDPARPLHLESWREQRKPAAVASDGGRLAVSDTARQGAFLEVGVDGAIDARAVFSTDTFMPVVALRGTQVVMSDGQNLTVVLELGGEEVEELVRVDRGAAVLMGEPLHWTAISPDSEWFQLAEGGQVDAFRSDDSHRPARLVPSEGRLLSLGGRGCDGVELLTVEGSPVLGTRFQIPGAECRAGLFHGGWVVGGTTGLYRSDGTRIQPTRVGDLMVLRGGEGFAIAVDEQKGVVFLDDLEQTKTRRRCGGGITKSSLLEVAPGELAAVDHRFAHITVVYEDDPNRCLTIPLQGPAADVWVDGDLVFVAEKLYGIEVFDRTRLETGAVGYFPLPGEDATALAVAGDRLFLGHGARGVSVHEIEGARIGPRVASWETTGTVSDLGLTGGHLLVADRSSLAAVPLEALR